MALNWAMINEAGTQPVPLPGEKIFFSAPGVDLSLSFKAAEGEKKWKAKGVAFVTNQRIIFLRQPPLPPSAVKPSDLNTLTVPFSNFLDTRYMIPVFSSPYYEASIIPVPGGGLPELSPAGSSSASSSSASTTSAFVQAKGRLIMHFNEGRGLEWRQAVEEVKARAEEMHGRAQHMEALPLYEPPPPAVSSSMNNNTITGSTSAATAAGSASGPAPAAGTTRSALDPTCSPTEPEPDILQAAGVAVELEEREREAEQRGAIVGGSEQQRAGEEGSHELFSGPEGRRPSHATLLHPGDPELPPAYEL